MVYNLLVALAPVAEGILDDIKSENRPSGE
jgi:hypothetical protein